MTKPMTARVIGMGLEFVAKARARVIALDDFNADNDPHREHGFGSFALKRKASVESGSGGLAEQTVVSLRGS